MSEVPVKAAAVKRKKKPRTWPAKVGFTLVLTVAVLYGLPSLFVPLAPEQAQLSALSRNWSAHHVVPYVAVCDHHAPGLHFLYLMSVMLFGARDGAILLFELLGILAIGVFTAVAAARRKLTPLEIAPLLLVSVVVYFTGVAASDSARGELWAALCVLAGQATISADTNRRKAAIVTGLWIGLALVVRPETVLFIPILFAQLLVAALAERPEPERWPTVLEIIAAFLVGMVQPPAAFSTYFTTRGAASAFRACALRLSALTQLYTDGSGKLASARDFALHHGWAIGLAVAGWVVAFFLRDPNEQAEKRRGEIRAVFIVPALLLTALAAVLLRAPESANWVLLVPFLTLGIADGLVATARRAIWLSLTLTILVVATLHFAPASAAPYRDELMYFFRSGH